MLHPESGSKSRKRQQCAGGESLCAVPGCAPRAPSRRGLLIPSRLRPRTRPSAEGPAQLKSPRPLTPRGHRGNLRARSLASREATVLRSQAPSAPPRAPGKARPGWRGTRAHAQTGGARQAPAPAPPPPRSEAASVSREPAAGPEANWEAELDVNRTSQTVSPAALRRRCGLEEGGDDDCDGLPGCPKWEWCGLPEGGRKRSRRGQAAASANGLPGR